VALHSDLDEAIAAAVAGLRDRHSWDQIARGLGISRQAACKRFGHATGVASLDTDSSSGGSESTSVPRRMGLASLSSASGLLRRPMSCGEEVA
jgi:hypothetical protein